MAPSRGCNHLLRSFTNICRPSVRRSSSFTRVVKDSANKAQIYISKSLDPYLNLSIEHYLLQNTPPESTVLFLYTNRPSIVIGRNQNPWFEVNLGLLRHGHLNVDLVRRRSGGGTVFHDEGNVNYSVICPPPAFDKDKHAHMVVRALNKLGIETATVNERHDIVMVKQIAGEDKTFKISGSAYKLVRQRSLHHGTCLLSSPNLPAISQYLRSKAKPFIKTRGVESVSSPITNTGVANEDFEQGVVREFREMYGGNDIVFVGEKEEDIPGIARGLEELKSLDWIYCQTPQFTFSYDHINTSVGPAKLKTDGVSPHDFAMDFTARHGEITKIDKLQIGDSDETFNEIVECLHGRKIHEIKDWTSFLSHPPGPNDFSLPSTSGESHPGLVMNGIFGSKKQEHVDLISKG